LPSRAPHAVLHSSHGDPEEHSMRAAVMSTEKGIHANA